MDKDKWMQQAVQSILDADEESAVEIARKSIADGQDPLEMINEGFSAGIKQMGDLFDRGEAFLPTLIIA